MNDIGSPSDALTAALRLAASALLSGCIGWERERLRKPAGFRTHILVGIGSCLMMLVSLALAEGYSGYPGVDPARIAANVVVGIGFLGAGTILHSREGWVSGLTTAASLWVVAGIGLAAGLGFHFAAVAATLLVLVVLFFLNKIDDYIERNLYHAVTLQMRMTVAGVERAKETLRKEGAALLKSEVRPGEKGEQLLVLHFKPLPIARGRELARKLHRLSGVKGVLFE